MRYTHISLSGYKRFQLNGIDHFEMVITSTLQVIIGSNGSGKSSLMWELSPLPANKQDFSKTGSKCIKIEHHNRLYVLSSSFSPKEKHSFLVDDIEFNLGGTITVQRELVKEHFGITNEIHELLTDREQFTTMPNTRRKEWFLRLCDTNYDYAIGVYNKFRERHRDVTGALKLTKKTLVQESEKLLQEEELVRIKTETHSLHECLNHLLEYRKPVEADLEELNIYQDRLDKNLTTLSKSMLAINEQIQDREHSVAEYADQIELANREILTAQTLITRFSDEHNKNEAKIHILEKAEANTIESLEFSLINLTTEGFDSKKNLLTNEIVLDAINALTSFESLRGSLQEIFDTIPNNKDGKYSSTALAEANEKLTSIKANKSSLLEQLAQFQASLKHMEEHKDKPDLLCPNCKHTFSLNYNEEKYIALAKRIADIENRLESVVYPELQEYETYVETCYMYGRLYRQYVLLTKASPGLNTYWNYLDDKKIISTDPGSGVHELTKIEKDLHLQISINQIFFKASEIQKTIDSLKSVGAADLFTLVKTNESLETDIAYHTEKLQDWQYLKDRSTTEFRRHTELKSLKEKIQSIIQEKRTLNKEEIETHRRLVFNNLVRELQSALASREHTLGAAAAQRNIVENLGKRIDEFTHEEQALAVLVKQLSPTEGLIAEGLLGFIKNFVDQMNALIKRIWTYPFIVQSCEVTEGDTIDLDYRFPMLVNNADLPISDVSKGSTGMQEIVNLAYRLTAMQYLGLQDSALYLDEIGNFFDAEHKRGLIYAIKSLIEQHTFSQIFLISHDYGQYGALVNSEYCVINSSNVIVPEKYNKHVIMK